FAVFSLIDRHALRPEMRKSFRHAFYAVVDLAGARLIVNIVLGRQDGPRCRSFERGIGEIPVSKGFINRAAVRALIVTDAEVIAIPLSQSLGIVGEQKHSADAVNQVHDYFPQIVTSLPSGS